MSLPSGRPAGGPFAAALAGGPPLVLDGGLSNQLAAQGCDLSGALWSARLLADAPEQIEAAHAAYLRAGAQVLITASYQATFEGFARRGTGRAETAALLRRSVRLARRAAERHTEDGAGGTGGPDGPGGPDGSAGGPERRAAGPATTPRQAFVAASVGPYGAMLADGAEYRGRYGLSVRELERFHRPRIEALAEAGPDVLALETVPDTDEAEALLAAAGGTGLPVWLSYTVAGGTTRAGQPLADAFRLAAESGQAVAVGVNCCDPADADAAVALAAEVTGLPVVVYPNSGEGWDAAARAWRGAATFAPERARAWRDAGARLIGGCCRVGPEGIASLARGLATG
ncbi:homocysteine S-methyltransferase [Streptomyces zingiberis]|uniref:Homocysteine S-methyltransferase n=1 Tax=Streptomyces zingiberis TaxID=2053010 RepID=A0ABX1BXI4_9ACTN|nr:homocysteine S-methyltransferase [Streptomyces zingiberis]NJQ01205.1 homocysteine S-methyltransferase [Streptomyces zingiberis]